MDLEHNTDRGHTMDALVIVTLVMGAICLMLASCIAGMMLEQWLTDPTK